MKLNKWQRSLIAIGSAVGSLMNPGRADLIAALGETTGNSSFQKIANRMKQTVEGNLILMEKPCVNSTNVAYTSLLPSNTFGSAYSIFMRSRGFSPDHRPPIRFLESEELAYVALRARQVHDFWHTLFGLPTNLIGETSLKVIELQQMMLPVSFLSVVGGISRFNNTQRSLFFRNYLPWAVRSGINCTDLMCVYYERYFHEDLEDVRRRWGIIAAPRFS